MGGGVSTTPRASWLKHRGGEQSKAATTPTTTPSSPTSRSVRLNRFRRRPLLAWLRPARTRRWAVERIFRYWQAVLLRPPLDQSPEDSVAHREGFMPTGRRSGGPDGGSLGLGLRMRRRGGRRAPPAAMCAVRAARCTPAHAPHATHHAHRTPHTAHHTTHTHHTTTPGGGMLNWTPAPQTKLLCPPSSTGADCEFGGGGSAVAPMSPAP